MTADAEPRQSAESVCPAGPDGVHYFFSDDECAYCHKLDQIADLERAHERALTRINRYALALQFYADETNWDSKVIRTAKDSEGNITGQECESGPAWDRGARARAALIDGSGGAGTMEP